MRRAAGRPASTVWRTRAWTKRSVAGESSRLGDEPGADGRVERAHHRDGRLARRLDEHGEVEAVALDGGQGEDLAGFLGETGQASGDHVAHAVRDVEATGGPG